LNDATAAGSSAAQPQSKEPLEMGDLDKATNSHVEPGAKRSLTHGLSEPRSSEAARARTRDGGTDGGTDSDDDDED
jgi:hypothetical protein